MAYLASASVSSFPPKNTPPFLAWNWANLSSTSGPTGNWSVTTRSSLHVVLTEMPHQTLDGPSGGITQSADGVTLNLFAVSISSAQAVKSGSSFTHVNSSNMSISLSWARPSTILSIMFIIHVVPSRHGVHCPQLSCL